MAILIPTMGRPDFIERTIAYYDSLNCPHPIYIGDASDSETSARTISLINRYQNVDVRYFHWECLSVQRTIVKLAEMAQEECRYSAFHGDDDYFVPASLSQCAEFLACNPDYRTAQGRAALIALDRTGPFGEILSLGDYWGVNEYKQITCVERLKSFCENYFVTQFSTHRTEEFVNDSEHYLGIKDDAFSELLHCFTFAIKGKSKFVDCLYLIRNVHEGINHPCFIDWVIGEHWASDYHKTINALSLTIQENSDLPLAQAKQIVTDVLKENMERRAMKAVNRGTITIAAMVNNKVPVSLKKAIRQVTCSDTDMRLLQSEKSLFHNNFLPVIKSLVKKDP